MTDSRRVEIAKTIVSQLGGPGKLRATVGVTRFTVFESGVGFRFKGSRKMNYCRINLNGLDLYDVEFHHVGKFDSAVVESLENVYSDQLVELFEKTTGLYIHL